MFEIKVLCAKRNNLEDHSLESITKKITFNTITLIIWVRTMLKFVY